MYREVQLDVTPEMEVFFMMFDRCHTKTRNTGCPKVTVISKIG